MSSDLDYLKRKTDDEFPTPESPSDETPSSTSDEADVESVCDICQSLVVEIYSCHTCRRNDPEGKYFVSEYCRYCRERKLIRNQCDMHPDRWYCHRHLTRCKVCQRLRGGD